ncbi:MAG TPA: hypothetical protein PKA64_01175 [Myxococcota bacterium]|nr:hypothetical protein [Myxococcota bacterium]
MIRSLRTTPPRLALATMAALAAGCQTIYELQPQGGAGSIEIKPGVLVLPRIDLDACTLPGCRDVCEDFSCCGVYFDPPANPFLPEAAPTEVLRERCCRTFEVFAHGRDNLVGSRWLPGPGSNLDVFGDVSLPFAAEPDVDRPLRGCYRMPGEKPDSCARAPESPACETGLPPDDGILRYFLEESSTVDIYVEVAK